MLPIDRNGTLPYTRFAAHNTCNSLRCFGAAGNKFLGGSANALDNFFHFPKSLVAGDCHAFVPARLRSYTPGSCSRRNDNALLAEEKRTDRLKSAYRISGGKKTRVSLRNHRTHLSGFSDSRPPVACVAAEANRPSTAAKQGNPIFIAVTESQ